MESQSLIQGWSPEPCSVTSLSLSSVVRCLQEPCQLSQTPATLWLWQQCCVAYPATNLSSTRSRDVTQLSSQGSTGVACLGTSQEEGRQEKEGKGSVCVHCTSAGKALGSQGSELQAGACDKYNGGCLGLIFNQLWSQRAAALWDVRNSFPLRKAGSGKADSP